MISGAMVVLLDSVAEFANTLMLYVDPVIRPLIVALVMFLTLIADTLCSPCRW